MTIPATAAKRARIAIGWATLIILNLAFAIAMAFAAVLPGLAFAVLFPPTISRRIMIAPLLGLAITGWVAAMAYDLRIPALEAAVGVMGLSAVLLIVRGRSLYGERDLLMQAAAFYLTALLGCLFLMSLTPWPASGPWSADWYSYLDQLNHLLSGAEMTGWTLARPPGFAGVAVPFSLALNHLVALQVAACALVAASLLVIYWAGGEVLGRRLGYAPLWVLLLSMFFVVNLGSVVPKFAQGALIVAAFIVLKGAAQSHTMMRVALAALLIGLAIEVHQSTVAYGVAFAGLLFHVSRGRLLRFVQLCLICLLILIIVVAVPELSRIARFGVENIVAYNPTVTMRGSTQPRLLFLLNLESVFLGWGYLIPAWNVVKSMRDVEPATLIYFGKWFVVIHQAMMANVLILIMLPLVFTLERLKSLAAFTRAHVPTPVLLGLTATPIVIAVLTPYPVSVGLVHAGGTALALGGFVLGMAWLQAEPGGLRNTLYLTFVSGAIWWVGWNVLHQLLLQHAGSPALVAPPAEDLNVRLFLQVGEATFGQGAFPWASLGLGLATALMMLALARQARR